MDRDIYEIIDDHLERDYRRASRRMLRQIRSLSTNPGSDMVVALNQLDQEAQDLTESGQPIQSTTKSYQKALAALGVVFAVTGTLIGSNAPAIQQSGIGVAPMGVTTRVFLNLTEDIIAKGVDPLSAKAFARYKTAIQNAGGQFIIPSPRFLSTYKACDFIHSAEWKAKMEKWGSGYYAKTREIFKNGLAQGWSPKFTAEKIREVATNIPYHAAENLTRTLQLNAYRQASLEVEKVNGNFLTGKIRIATLDERTCLSCIALHGTPIPLGEAVEDHYRGRCTEFYQVPGGDEFPTQMQSDSLPGKRNFVPYKSGEEWFASLPPERQAKQRSFLNSPAKLRAYQDGNPLSAFVGDHYDPVFGNQKIEQSLKSIGGQQYYSTSNFPVIQRLSPAAGTDTLRARMESMDGMPLSKVFGGKATLHNSNGVSNLSPMSQSQLSRALRLVDSKALKGIPEIRLAEEDAFVKLYKGKSDPKKIAGFYNTSTGVITMKTDNLGSIDPFALVHEIGHNVQHKSSTYDLWKIAYESDPEFDRHTEYSKKNTGEGFAETFAGRTASRKKDAWESFNVVSDVLGGL